MNPTRPTHEELHRHDTVVGPSDRSFGLVFAIVFAVIGFFPVWQARPVRLWAVAVAGLFCTLSLALPGSLAPLNRVWFRVGVAMHTVMNPVILTVLFYGLVTPFGLLARAFRKGTAPRLRPDPTAATYWISRARQPRSRMDRQF